MTVIIFRGDVFERLADLPADHFDCVVTSPPYWGLRDYGVEGQIGLEPTLGEHIDVMVRVFAEVHRVLKPEGTCWVNYGDCYATTPNGRSAADTKADGKDDRTFRDKPFSTIQGALKPKDLVMVPNRFAIAMQEWGWWVRSEIIWAKPNPMPESVTDRPATSHEKIFLFTKSARYFYDAEAVRFALRPKTLTTYTSGPRAEVEGDSLGKVKKANWSGMPRKPRATEGDKQRGHSRRHAGFNDRWDAMEKAEQVAEGRNLRNYEPAPVEVWPIATRPFKEAHFATFPPELVERCLNAGCPKGGRVLDPFGGAGTTGLVADRMQMDATLIELNDEYADMAERRIKEDRGALFGGAEIAHCHSKQIEMFD